MLENVIFLVTQLLCFKGWMGSLLIVYTLKNEVGLVFGHLD